MLPIAMTCEEVLARSIVGCGNEVPADLDFAKALFRIFFQFAQQRGLYTKAEHSAAENETLHFKRISLEFGHANTDKIHVTKFVLNAGGIDAMITRGMPLFHILKGATTAPAGSTNLCY